MADEDDIRDLMGRLTAARRQGVHVTPAAIKIILAALRFYLAARSWLARPRGDPHDDVSRGKPEPPDGPLPTIGSSRRQGLVACYIQCEGPDCWRQARFTFDELGLPDETVFVEIPHRRGFHCRQCGCRRVRVSPDWRNHAARGNGRAVP